MSTRTKITALPALLLLAAVTMPLGCAVGPQPTQMYGTKDLPKDWLALQGSDWRLDVLTPSTREYLQRVRENMSTERTGAEYRFYGRYSDATMKQMAEANEFASSSFLTASKTLNKNLTPELYGTAETYDDANWHYAANANDELRSMKDDWGRFWLTDRPSKLSPFPITPTGGQP